MPHRPLASRNLDVRKLAEDSDGNRGVFADEVQQEAKEVLQKVGWASPINDVEMTSEDPFVKQIDAGIQADFGFGLDDLLNPAKVCSPKESNVSSNLWNLSINFLRTYRSSIWKEICSI